MINAVHRAWRLRMRIPIILSVLYLAPGVLMPWVSYDLRSIRVTDGLTAEGAWVQADRSTHLGGNIRFRTIFYSAVSGLPVCSPRWSEAFPYQRFQTGVIDKPLWWWVGGKDVLRRCMSEGLHDGEFYSATCHELMAFGDAVGIAQRCVESNTFRLGDRRDAS